MGRPGRPYIVLGDKTSHGGTVLEAESRATINGKPIACKGHMTYCPVCKGTFPITTGAENYQLFDKPAARHGDKTACGASLIASQTLAIWLSDGSGAASPGAQAAEEAAAAYKAANIIAPAKDGICLDCLAKAAKAGTAMLPRGG